MANPKPDKKERLARALRDNLRRRKAQARTAPDSEQTDIDSTIAHTKEPQAE